MADYFHRIRENRQQASEERMPKVQRLLKNGKWGKPVPERRQYIGPSQLETDEQLLERLHRLNPDMKFRIGAAMSKATVVPKQYSAHVNVWRDGCMLRASLQVVAAGKPSTHHFELDLRPIATWVADYHRGLHESVVPECVDVRSVSGGEVCIGALQYDASAAARAAAIRRATAQAQAKRALALRTAAVHASSARAQAAAHLAAQRAARAAQVNAAQLRRLPAPLQAAAAQNAATVTSATAAAQQGSANEEDYESEEDYDAAEELEAQNDEAVEELEASVGARYYRTRTRVHAHERRRPGRRTWRSAVHVDPYMQDRWSPRFGCSDSFGGFPGSVFHAINKIGKKAIGGAIAKTVKSIVRSKIVGAAIGATAVLFPPVGVPAAAAYATANVALNYIDKAEKVRQQATKLLRSGQGGVAREHLPEIKALFLQEKRAKQALAQIAARAKAGDREAMAAAKIIALTHKSRKKMENLAPKSAGGLTGVLVTAEGGRALKGNFVRVA